MSDCRRSVRFAAVSSCAGEQQQAAQITLQGCCGRWLCGAARSWGEGVNGATFLVGGFGDVHVQVQKEKKVVENCMEWSKIWAPLKRCCQGNWGARRAAGEERATHATAALRCDGHWAGAAPRRSTSSELKGPAAAVPIGRGALTALGYIIQALSRQPRTIFRAGIGRS